MADFTRTVETAERVVYTLKVPTNLIEVAKVSDAAARSARDLADQKNSHLYDDDVTVEADEEEIRLIIITKPWGRDHGREKGQA